MIALRLVRTLRSAGSTQQCQLEHKNPPTPNKKSFLEAGIETFTCKPIFLQRCLPTTEQKALGTKRVRRWPFRAAPVSPSETPPLKRVCSEYKPTSVTGLSCWLLAYQVLCKNIPNTSAVGSTLILATCETDDTPAARSYRGIPLLKV